MNGNNAFEAADSGGQLISIGRQKSRRYGETTARNVNFHTSWFLELLNKPM